MIGLLITTRGRADLLSNSLDRLAGHTLPNEILVVDDGTEDRSVEQVCRRFDSQLPLRYVYHHNPGATLCCEARNVGLKLLDTPLIITSEPEIAFESNVVSQMRSLHDKFPDKIITAGTVFVAPSAGVLNPGECERRLGWSATYCALYARSWLMEVNGWDEEFPGTWGWDDTDLLTRLRLKGHGQHISDQIEVLHQWHEPNQDNQSVNEQHFRSKTFHQDWTDLTDAVANKEREWGVLRARP